MSKTRKILFTGVFACSILGLALTSPLQNSYAAPSVCSPTETTYGSYISQTFTTVGTCNWVVPAGVSNVDVLIVGGGGGGGGGAFGGGGGAGGFVEKTGVPLSAGTTMSVTVGYGGTGGIANYLIGAPNNNGTNGGDSTFNSLVAKGGGGGAGYYDNNASPRTPANGVDGGSGGGGSEKSTAGGISTQDSYSGSGFGNAGGYSTGASDQSGGGGGGAGGAGGNGGNYTPGTGGVGKTSTIKDGTSVTYATGGNGGRGLNPAAAVSGSANTGDGGQGANFNNSAALAGGNGGSGIIIIRWASGPTAPGTPGQPTAVAGNGEATVTVVAPTTGDTPTSYLVTATPGGATCTVTGASGSCTITGLTNGTAYTFTSTATNAGGTSSSSVASTAVTPTAPSSAPTSPSTSTETSSASPSSTTPVAATTISLGASIGQPVAGSAVDVTADGLKANSDYSLVVRSTPKTLASGITSGSSLSLSAKIPSGLEAGWHSLTFSSTASNGNAIVSTLYFEVSSKGTLVKSTGVEPTAHKRLAKTGADVTNQIGIAVLLMIAGFSMLFGARKNFSR